MNCASKVRGRAIQKVVATMAATDSTMMATDTSAVLREAVRKSPVQSSSKVSTTTHRSSPGTDTEPAAMWKLPCGRAKGRFCTCTDAVPLPLPAPLPLLLPLALASTCSTFPTACSMGSPLLASVVAPRRAS